MNAGKCSINVPSPISTQVKSVHNKNIHKKTKDFRCDQCSFTSIQKVDLNQHLKDVHRDSLNRTSSEAVNEQGVKQYSDSDISDFDPEGVEFSRGSDNSSSCSYSPCATHIADSDSSGPSSDSSSDSEKKK